MILHFPMNHNPKALLPHGLGDLQSDRERPFNESNDLGQKYSTNFRIIELMSQKSEKRWDPRRNGGGRVVWGGWSGLKLLGWLGGLNVAPTIPLAHILLTLN